MNQRNFWDKKWAGIGRLIPATNFAKRTYNSVQDMKYKTILDLGCGDGKDSLYFAGKGYNVTALDFSKSALNMLSKRKGSLKIDIVKSDIRKMNLNKRFDIIYSNLSIHYFNIQETIKIVDSLYKLLKKSGMIFVRVKSTDDVLFGLGEEIEEHYYDINGKKVRLFTKDELLELFSDFRVCSIRKTSSKLLTMEKGLIKSSFVEIVAEK